MSTDKKIKIAYIIPALYYPSGMERVVILKANYFTEHFGYEVHIILTDGKGKEPSYALNPAVKVHQLDINFEELYQLSLPKRIVGYFSKQQKYKRELNICLNSISPDITISTLRREINFVNKMTDGSIKIGEIHFNKSNYRDFTQNKLPGAIQRIVKYFWMKQLIVNLKHLKKFVVLSFEDKECWTELDNVEVIYNPLSFTTSKFSTCNNKQVIAVGRYTYQKGFDRLLPAWKIVCEKHPDWVLRIFGGGNKDSLQIQIDELNIGESCILEPSTPDIIDKYCESSIFVLSSRYEGFGMVITEAMSCGVPPVSFACPCGPKDIITEGEDGLLVPNGDIGALAQKICYLMENETLRKQMGTQAIKNVQRFNINNIALQWKALFEECLKH